MKPILFSKSGQSILEYSLIIAVLVLVIVSAIPSLRSSVTSVFSQVETSLEDADSLLASGNYVYEENFDNLDNWNVSRGEYEIDNQGRLINTRNGEGRIFTDYSGDDFQMNIDVAQLTEGQGYGIWFRASDTGKNEAINGYTFQYDPGYGSGAFLLRKWENGHESSPFGRVNAPDYDWNSVHNVTLHVEGDTYTAYIDGEVVVSGSDETYQTGEVGFRTWGKSRSYFDNITIEETD
ncbi:MAG: DUF1080 domain-containing protein [Caldisericia bacterium]|nr:DUF1080 domain-containing protein [Caldisericia bacterium]